MSRPRKSDQVGPWLRAFLRNGSRSAEDVFQAAKDLGISPRTLNTVKVRLGVESVRRGATFFWRDPDVNETVENLNLVVAVRELTQAIRILARHQQPGSSQAASEQSKASSESLPPLSDFYSWSEDEFEKATPEEILKYSDDVMLDLKEATDAHGKPSLSELGVVIDRTTKINHLKRERQRCRTWFEKKLGASGPASR